MYVRKYRVPIYIADKTDCQNLNNLLIPACKVELFVKLGEGT